MDYTQSASVERAREMLKRLHDRNQRTWDDLDRDVAFAIEALIASAERYRFIAHRLQAQPVAWLPPDPPPECKSEAEKTAFAFGWFKALESRRTATTGDKP
jgi:hypothetical protein